MPNYTPSPPEINRAGRPTVAGKGLGHSSSARAGRGRGAQCIGLGGKGKGLGGKKPQRHRKILRDNIGAITKGDIKRLARRGGVKRISGQIYGEIRGALQEYLQRTLRDVCAITDHCRRKTATVSDVIFALKQQGRPIYGFDPETYGSKEHKQ